MTRGHGAMQRDQLFHAVYEALSPGHCAVCQVSLEGVQRFLDGFMYERVNDPWSREQLIRARGFCADHAWWLTRIQNSPSGVAILCHYRFRDEPMSDAEAASWKRVLHKYVGAPGVVWRPTSSRV